MVEFKPQHQHANMSGISAAIVRSRHCVISSLCTTLYVSKFALVLFFTVAPAWVTEDKA